MTYAVDAGELLGHHHHHGDDEGLPQGRVDQHLLQGDLRNQLHALLKCFERKITHLEAKFELKTEQL